MNIKPEEITSIIKKEVEKYEKKIRKSRFWYNYSNR